MKKLKFNEYDRHHVKSEIEIQLNTKLNTVGTYRKYFMDYNGSAYLIFGGIENWHGIQSKILKDINKTNGFIFISKRYSDRIDVFIGDLQKFVKYKYKLNTTLKGDYQFTFKIRNDTMVLDQIPSLSLKKLFSVLYSVDDKIIDQQIASQFIGINREEIQDMISNIRNKDK